MLTLSDLNKAAQMKKAAANALTQVSNATIATGKAVLSVAEAAKQAVGGVMPVTRNMVESAQHDVLMVIADIEQRVNSIEDEMQITTETSEEKSEEIVQGYRRVMEARRNRTKQVKEELKIEESVVIVTEAPVVDPKPKGTRLQPNVARKMQFDELPKLQ